MLCYAVPYKVSFATAKLTNTISDLFLAKYLYPQILG